jgi:hypothetical protein
MKFYFAAFFTKAPAIPATPKAMELQTNGESADDVAMSKEPPTMGDTIDPIRPIAEAIPLP